MPHELGKHPGAVWLKSDLQCHSPRDRSWTDPPSLPGGDPAGEAAREAWAAEFIAECQRRRLMLVAVTDHHDVTFASYVIKAAAADGLTLVLPGVEVTCSDNAQCLVLFDPGTDEQAWSHLLGKLSGVTQAPRTEPKTTATVNAQITISDLFAAITGDKALRDSCVFLPHFSDGDAHKHLNAKGFHDRFASMECDGVYIEKAFSDLEETTKNKAYGLIADWGNRRRAIIATGDNRSPGWERLGQNECWIKLGENTIESLRQAFLADEARISYEQPVIPTERIVSLTVFSSLTGGKILSMTFNPGFNAVIGGRGSGKSALLEYLRFGLGRTARDLPGNEDEAPALARDAQLIDDTLDDDGYVEVKIEREGVIETWSRRLSDRDVIKVLDEDGHETTLTIEDAQRRFPARAFYQKGLSTTMNDSARAAEHITGIAAAEQLDKRREIDTSIDKAKRLVATRLRDQSAFWQIQLERKRAQARIDDLKKRVAAVAARLEKEGVSKDALAIISQTPLYDRAKNYQGQVNRARSNDIERLEALKKNFLNVTITAFKGAEAFPVLTKLEEAVVKARTDVIQHLDAALAAMNALGDAYVTAMSAFDEEEKVFQAKLGAATAAQAAHKQLIEESAKLAAELKLAEQSEFEIAAQEEAAKNAPEQFRKAVTTLVELTDQRAKVLSAAAQLVEGKSSKMLKARYQRDPRPVEHVEAVSKLFVGSRVHDVEMKVSERVAELAPRDATPGWSDFRDGILEVYASKISAGAPPEPGDDIAKRIGDILFSKHTLTAQQVNKIYQNLSDDTLSNVFTAVPRDYIVMTYVDQGRDIDFAKASPGQQASALLELLLQQSAGTLIIDQPEDDLDNRIIMHIVKLIRTSKSRRQLLFTTHNPNIVVNGDADKIIALKSGQPPKNGEPVAIMQLEVDGAIESPEVRKVITHVMEGGKEAFDLRNRKYNFSTIAE